MSTQKIVQHCWAMCLVLALLLGGLPIRLATGAQPPARDDWQEFLIPSELLAQGQAEAVLVSGRTLVLMQGADVGMYTSPVLRTPQPFTDTGPHWRATVDAGAQLVLQVRTGSDGLQWSDWITVTASDEIERSQNGEFFAPLIFVPQDEDVHQHLQFRLTFHRASPEATARLDDLTFFLVDSRAGPTTAQAAAAAQQRLESQPDSKSLNVTAVNKPRVISRTEWGCPEGQSSPRWTPRYADTHHIIVHHTDTPNNDTNWAQRVRSIWSYHANSKGWGDIGYNYLIDPNGYIYEGRAGGDNVTGAHAGNHNTGTMGVSFIGCFHSTCASNWGDKTPRPAALEAAAALMAWKTSQRGLDPQGSAAGYPIIAGHRDVNQTACPGSELYPRLPQLRQDAKARLNPERDNITLSYGQSDDNVIDPRADHDTYYFTGATGQSIRITMDKTGGDLDPYVELYNPDGSLLGIDDDSGGNRNSKLERTLAQNGRYRIVARSWNDCCTGTYRLGLSLLGSGGDTDDNRWLAFGQSLQGTINPNDDRDIYYFSSTRGRVVSIRMNKIDNGLDPLVELWKPDGTFLSLNDDGGGDRNSWLVAELPQDGVYRIVARSWNLSSSGRYHLRLAAEQASNLAQGKRTVVSSIEVSWLNGPKAVDGDMGTRWSSQFSDPNWIYIDLGQDRTFDQVKLRWETAYGRQYGIYVQPNAWAGTSNWINVYYTTNGDGGLDTINFNPVTARFVLMYGVQRGTQWGYSLWEFEIYNTAATPLPIVEPDPGDKGPEAVPLEEPPLPADAGKDIALTGEGEDAQENMPAPAGDAAAALVNSGSVYTAPVVYIPGPALLELPQGALLTLTGNGHDPDGGALAQYRWYADFAGQVTHDDEANSLPMVGTTATLELDTTILAPGLHTFYFQAQDDEGEWSATATVQVRLLARVYLPLISR